MPLTDSSFDKFCRDKLKMSGLSAIIIGAIVLVIIIVAIVLIIVFAVKKSKRESYTTSTIPTTGLKDELKKCIQTWNSTIDSYYGINSNKDGFSFSKLKKSEPYERTRLANDFEYLKAKEVK